MKLRIFFSVIFLLSAFTALPASVSGSGEQKIFDAFFRGDDQSFSSELENYVRSFPSRPEIHFYARDLYNIADIAGPETAIGVFRFLEGVLSAKNDPSSQLLKRRIASFRDDLEYRYRRSDGTDFASKYFPVTKWNISSPFRRYGKGDMAHQFTPEFNAGNFHLTGSKPVTVKERSGFVYPERFLYPSKGVAYASTSLSSAGGLIVRVESNREYQLFVNGRRIIDNRFSSKYRNARSVRITGTESALLMIKIDLSDDAFFRMTAMDSSWNPKAPSYSKLIAAAGSGSAEEVQEQPYEELSAEYNAEKSAGTALKLGWYFSEYDDVEAVKWYETSLSLKDDPAVRAIYSSECIRLGSLYSCAYLEGKGKAGFARLALRYPDCVPARNAVLKEKFVYDDRVEITKEIMKAARSGKYDFDGFDQICRYLEDSGDTGSLKDAAETFAASFPRSLQPIGYLAKSCAAANPEKALVYCRAILEKERDQQLADLAAHLAAGSGNRRSEEFLTGYIDDPTAPAAYTAAALLIDCGRYNDARNLLLQMAAVKDDPRIYESMGRLKLLSGSTPDMYWEKAAASEPSSRFPRDYLSYKTEGKSLPILDSYRDHRKIQQVIGDFTSGKKSEAGILYRSAVQKIYQDRSGRYFFEEFINIRNRQDVERYGEYRIPFDKNLAVRNCSVIRHDGSATESYAVHGIDGEKYLTVSGLAPEHLLHIAYEVDNYLPLLPGSSLVCSGSLFMNGYDEQVEEYSSVIEAPEEMALSVASSDGATVERNQSGAVSCWTIRAHSLPAMREEARGAEPERFLGWYSFTECGTYDDLGEWYRGLWPDRGLLSVPPLEASSRQQTVRNVYEFLSRKIVLDERSLFTPVKPGDMLFAGKGSSEDKVFCAKEILAEFGIPSMPALVMRKGTPSGTIRSDMFSNVILCIPGGDEGNIYLDFSHQYYPAGVLASSAENSRVCIIGNDGTVSEKIAHSSIRSAEKYVSTLEIGPAGEAGFSLSAVFSGINTFVEKYADDERYRDELSGIIAGLFHRNADVMDVAFLPDPAYGEKALSIRGKIPGFALMGSGTLSFLPFFHSTELPSYLSGESRLSPLVINEAISTDERIRILLPPGFESETVAFEKTVSFSRGAVRCAVKKEKGSSVVVVERTVLFPECEIDAESYGEFLRFCAGLREIEQMRITLSK